MQNDLSLDLLATLRNNDSLRPLKLWGISLVGRAPSIDVAEEELRTLQKCNGCISNVLLESSCCICS